MKLVDDTSFSVPVDKPIDAKVFVYGKQHDDVRMVDYDAISMLNVSATQELAKEVDADRAKIADQDKKIAALEAENAKLTALSGQMEALKKVVATMQQKENGSVRTVALER